MPPREWVLRILGLLVCFFLCGTAISADKTVPQSLTVGWLHDNVNERYLIADIEAAFNKVAPHIQLNAVGIHTDRYRAQVAQWLKNGDGPDVLYWYGNGPLQELANRGLVENIDSLWEINSLNNVFSDDIISQITLNDQHYGIPVSYYPWSFYYNHSLFERLGLSPPTTWNEFLNVCQKLKQNNITPIAIGYNAPWVLTSWFEYMNLRLNGLEFHQTLLDGGVSYKNEKVISVLNEWKLLIENGYFLESGESMGWYDPMPFLYRELAGVTLIGHFLSSRIPTAIKNQIKTFPFPDMITGQPRVELAPVDVFFIRASSEKQELAKQFLAFMATTEAQATFNLHAGGFSPLLKVDPAPDYFSLAGTEQMQNAHSTVPYFDRAVPMEFANAAMEKFKVFMQEPNVNKLANDLEALRQSAYEPD